MENMEREQIKKIASSILSSSDIIAKHGTSVSSGLSIMKTGFNFTRTSYVIDTSKNIESLCSYGWKENNPDDAVNVIISVPREFFMDLFCVSSEEYSKWIENVKKNRTETEVLKAITHFEYSKGTKAGKFQVPPSLFAHIPKEFIAGMFVWCNGKTYLTIDKDESALDNLNFISNEKFYLNLNQEERQIIINEMRKKLGIEEENKSLK